MSRQINQPSNQIKLTNVSLVRLKKGKKRFEIACYKNKVLEWRSGIETDLDNVLQVPQVFLNVSKGQTAPKEDVEKAFGKGRVTDEVVLEILKKGELQVGEKERAAQHERVQNEVVGIVASRLVDPRTKRVYTRGMIEKALDMLSSGAHPEGGQQQQEGKDNNKTSAKIGGGSGTATPISSTTGGGEGEGEGGGEGGAKPRQQQQQQQHPVWTGVSTTKSAKSQALEAMKALIAAQPIPVQRARMKLRVSCSTVVLKQAVKAGGGGGGGAGGTSGVSGSKDNKKGKKGGEGDDDQGKAGGVAAGTVKDRILGLVEQVESQDVVGSEWEVVGFVEPGAFKGLSDFIGNETRGQGRIEVLDMAVTHED